MMEKLCQILDGPNALIYYKYDFYNNVIIVIEDSGILACKGG